MTWITVYIKGRSGFQDAVFSKLKDNWMNGNVELRHNVMMFWLKDSMPLRKFKLAIGSQTIFKFRLRFFTDLEEFVQSEQEEDIPFMNTR